MDFKTLLMKKEFIILDGAMGTMLQKSGLKAGEIPELLSITNPELIIDIHKKYIDAGSDIIYANTFGANSHKLKNCKYNVADVIGASVANAKKACAGTSTLVALDIGPIGQLLEPSGTLTFEEAYSIFKEQIIAGKDADLIVIETMTDLYEIKAAVLAAKENSSKPIICTMTFESNMRTFTGCTVSSMALTLEGLKVDALGINCSLGPKELFPLVRELSLWTNLPMVIKPNAGMPNLESNEYDITPDEFCESLLNLIPFGIKIVGGCCGTTPEFISRIKQFISKEKYIKAKKQIPCAVCTPSKTVLINEPRIIGERINPTGKKRFKQALIDNDIDYILGQAIEQIHAGAEILDVNVGIPEIDEKAMMIRTVKALQSIADVPLQIDSSDPKAVEAALRIYNGKPIVNSVNGEESSLRTILPLVAKYGAAVVGLTLDDKGIPKTAKERFMIAKRIMDRALSYGIPKEDIYIDCLTLTASAQQEGVVQTLNAMSKVKNELGLKTVLGVSNISFGLPNRELINSTFLTMALTMGLSLPIINPNIASMTGAVRAFKMLNNTDKNCMDFIAAYNNEQNKTENVQKGEIDIFYCIENGLKKEGSSITYELLKTTDAMTVVNDMLIPALDKVGADFESGKVFLPQLILSAQVAQEAFEVIKRNMINNNIAPVNRGKIVLATVKGDIHDIGKNIVKVLLENYGYNIIDLGCDVDYNDVLKAVRYKDVKLVGLSALMTTTLKNMEKTIELLREHGYEGKIMVGGAVLTREYALKIGADYYSKDAKEGVDIAKRVFND